MKIEKQFKKEIAHVLKTYGSQKIFAQSMRIVLESKQPESKQPESNNNNYTIQENHILDFFEKYLNDMRTKMKKSQIEKIFIS